MMLARAIGFSTISRPIRKGTVHQVRYYCAIRCLFFSSLCMNLMCRSHDSTSSPTSISGTSGACGNCLESTLFFFGFGSSFSSTSLFVLKAIQALNSSNISSCFPGLPQCSRARMITQAELQAVARVFCLSICKNKAGKGCNTRKNISPRLRGKVCMEAWKRG